LTAKKITIALISNSSDELKRFSVPKYLLPLSTIFIIICGAYLGWVITDYQILKSKMPLLDQLQKENVEQRLEFALLAKRIKEMTPVANTTPGLDHKSNGMQKMKQAATGQIPEVHDQDQPKPVWKLTKYHIGGGESPKDAVAPVRGMTPVPASIRGDTTPQKTNRSSDAAAVGSPDKTSKELPVGLSDENTFSAIKNGSTQEQMEQYPYSLQIGSYRTLKRADKAISDYRRKGLSPYWVKVDLGENGVWYRVLVGHCRDKETAKTFRQEHGMSGALIKKIAYANLIGIYSVEEQYEAEVKNLEKNGYFPYVIKDEEGMLRLYVGAFFTRDGVEQQHHELTGHRIQSEIVKR
jgi:cell division septation protein DedD